MMMYQEMKAHLENVILPFWMKLRDEKRGGFFGYMDYDLHVDEKSMKGCILNSRIMWTFSSAYCRIKNPEYLVCARHAFNYLKCFLDKENGGVYWALTFDGKPYDKTKHTYCQAFAIYGLIAYAQASGEREPYEMALTLFELIEEKCIDENGYTEAADEAFRPIDNGKLSENGVMADKTMNTLLHILEAYTTLYRYGKDERVKARVLSAIDMFMNTVYDKQGGRLNVFFDKAYKPIIDMQSYGHDIEGSWLIDEAAHEVLTGEEKDAVNKEMLCLAQSVYERAYRDGVLLNEREKEHVDPTRVWWVQAEAVVGFANAYQISGDTKYLDAAKDIWQTIQNKLVDKREGGEWFWALDEHNEPHPRPIVEPWKCPYHNGRMCMELMDRQL